MKVVHVTQPVEAGVAAVVLDLARAQRRRGWDVTIACPPGRLADEAGAAGIPVRSWLATRSPGPRTALELLALRKIVRALQPDVVHLHSSKAGLGRLVLRGRTPTLFQPHLWSFRVAGGLLSRACRVWESLASRWTHLLLCVSDDELAVGRAAGVTAPAGVVCNGVDTRRLRPRPKEDETPTAVCVGRVAHQKGQDLLLRAWPLVLAAVPDARLVIVGDGPMAAALRATGHPAVHWHGHSDAVDTFYAEADVVVLPSRAEGMALVPLEAMACGRPVVAFDVEGVRQSLGDAGEVVPAGDVSALAHAVALRLADPELAAAEGKRGRVRAETLFDRDRMTDQVLSLTAKLVPEGGRR
ncbi:Glycosyltransferase involved in cell wall bisynthesis [Lentzea xinjiangensis]|uniref:Glycosyltransferase involved in cell wall bisynthesis n=1 Tax=Lentzea xinjiangensis TaxID=402600 RepID=A0A1H9J118_9PSEU|nr:glycosyltransferase [Lentzea xinjiangensis]SEQ80459.1 Glycosyltransferase involved in cell wall bisynthesis [Lentzea xinjiangensis]